MIESLIWKKPDRNIFWIVAPYDPYTRRDKVAGRKIELVHPDTGGKHNCEILRYLDICKFENFQPVVLNYFNDSTNNRVHKIFIEGLKTKPEFQKNIKEFKDHAKAIVLELIQITKNE